MAGLDVWFRRDIANALQAVAVANTDQGERRDAFMRALVAVGLTFGLVPVESEEQIRKGERPTLPAWVEREDYG